MPTTSLIVFALLTNPFADSVISYDAGTSATDGYTDPTAAIGEPTRFTGEGVWPSVVSQFNPPFMTNELVSIGIGGELVISFNEPVLNYSFIPKKAAKLRLKLLAALIMKLSII